MTSRGVGRKGGDRTQTPQYGTIVGGVGITWGGGSTLGSRLED